MPKSPGQSAAHTHATTTRRKKDCNITSIDQQNQHAADSGKVRQTQCSKQTETASAVGSPSLRRSPRIKPADNIQVHEQHERRTPASAKKATKPAPASMLSEPCSGGEAATSNRSRASKSPIGVSSPAGKTSALRKTPGRSPLRQKRAAAVTPAAVLRPAATPAVGAASAAPSTIKTHQRRRSSLASKMLAPTAAWQQVGSTQNVVEGAQSAPAAVGGKRKARSSQAVELSPNQAGARKKRRVTMPAGM